MALFKKNSEQKPEVTCGYCLIKGCRGECIYITQQNLVSAWNLLSAQPASSLRYPSLFMPWSQNPLMSKEAHVKMNDGPESTEVCRGWRTMFLNEKYQLVGSYARVWPTRTMTAECGSQKGMVLEHRTLVEVATDHLSTANCTCGIWSHKNYPEYLEKRIRIDCASNDIAYAPYNANRLVVVATSVHYGVVVEGTEGYRSERADLEALYLIVPRKCRAGHGLRLKTETAATLDPTVKAERVWRDELQLRYYALIDGREYYIDDKYIGDLQVSRQGHWVDAEGNSYVPPVGESRACVPHWECVRDGDGDSNLGAALAVALQSSYGIPCRAIGAAEFIYRNEKGEF